MSEKMMGRERCKDKGTSRTVHTECQKPGAHLQASVFAPKERLTARSAPKDGPGRETLDQENIFITGRWRLFWKLFRQIYVECTVRTYVERVLCSSVPTLERTVTGTRQVSESIT